MDQIVSETNVSKGKVHYLINDWKNEIGLPYIDELREFSVTVRKSGISIGQCVQGFRMISILKNLGIHEGDANDGIDNKYEGNYKEFSSFIEDIYKNCKREGVEPSIIPAWIKDLFDFYNSSIKDKNESFFSLNEDPADGFDNNTDNSESSNTQPKLIAKRFDESIPNHPHQQNSPSFRSHKKTMMLMVMIPIPSHMQRKIQQIPNLNKISSPLLQIMKSKYHLFPKYPSTSTKRKKNIPKLITIEKRLRRKWKTSNFKRR